MHIIICINLNNNLYPDGIHLRSKRRKTNVICTHVPIYAITYKILLRISFQNITRAIPKQYTPIQPFILICGTPCKPKDIIEFFDCIQFKLFSISSAIDVCFKIFHIFNLEYPPQSSTVWLFIQKYFYVLNTKYDKGCHTLGQILSDLNSE